MINCRKYTRYLHKSEITELLWYEKILMKYHYVVCHLCKHYTSENIYLNDILSQQKTDLIWSDTEIEEYKNQLIKQLNL